MLELRGNEISSIGFTDLTNLFILHSDADKYVCSRMPLIDPNENQFCFRDNGYNTFGSLQINNGSLSASYLSFGNLRQWQLFDVEVFDQVGSINNWKGGQLYSCNNRQVLRSNSCQSHSISKVFTKLPEHQQVKVTAIVDFLDKWKGDFLTIKLNGQIIQQISYDWCRKTFQHICVDTGINVCGSADYPDRIGMKIEGEVRDNSDEFVIEISASFDQTSCSEASWAIESIEIELK